MSLPGAGEAEPTTILEELNRSLVSSTSQQEEEPTQLQRSQQQQHHQQDNQSNDGSDDADHSNDSSSDDNESCSDDDDDDLSENVSVIATVAVQEIVQPNENEKCLRSVRTDSDRSRTTSASDVEDLNANNSDEPEVSSERLAQVHCDIATKIDVKSAEELGHDNEHHITNAIITNELEQINDNNKQVLLDGAEAVSLQVDDQVKSILNENYRVVDEPEESNSTDGPENGFNIFRQEGYVPFRDSLEREISPPPVPLVTYRWEEARRAREKVKNDLFIVFYTYMVANFISSCFCE